MARRVRARRGILPAVQRYQGLLGLVVLLSLAAIVEPRFFSGDNLANVLNQLAIPGTLALGATFVILSGGIDLSAGSLFGLLNCVTASWCAAGAPLWGTALYVLGLGTAVGALIGWVVGWTRLQPFVVTLAAMVTLRGVAFLYTEGRNISGIGDALAPLQESYFGLPVQAHVLIVVTLLSQAALVKTRFGRHLYAVGGNPRASRYSGLPVERARTGAYAANGFLIALAAVMFTAKTNNGQPSAGMGYELDAIAAAVVGGCSLIGGYGNALGTFTGALFIVSVSVLLILKGINYHVGLGLKGIIILAAVYLQNLGRK
jgi:ribose transport system permease protein